MDATTTGIPLGRSGLTTLVDTADLPLLKVTTWQLCRNAKYLYAYGYLPRLEGGRRRVKLHRYLLGEPAGMLVDHRNHDGLDNRRANLRVATHRENTVNTRPHSISGYKGVDRSRDKFAARIKIYGEQVNLGTFASPIAAALAYDRAAREAFGEFACTNFGSGEQLAIDWQQEPPPLTLF